MTMKCSIGFGHTYLTTSNMKESLTFKAPKRMTMVEQNIDFRLNVDFKACTFKTNIGPKTNIKFHNHIFGEFKNMTVIHNVDFQITNIWQWYIILILGSQCTTNYAYVFVLASTMTWKNSYLETNTKPKTNSIYHNHTCERFTNITVTHHIDFRLTMHDKFHIVLVLGYVLDWRKA